MAKRSQPTELECYLQARAQEGQADSKGEFTLARKAALKKLANFQLPFKSAWAVKIIQSIVAGKAGEQIKVEICSTSIRFYFTKLGFSLQDLEAGFFNPEPSSDKALSYLLSALWVIGIGKRWGFQVALSGEKPTLIWDGGELRKVESERARTHSFITIAPLERKSSTAFWIVGMVTAGYHNADIFQTIKRFCHVCPLPLTVDGRRLDALQNASIQGWSNTSYPIALAALATDLNSFTLPPGTFLKSVGAGAGFSPVADLGGGLKGFAQAKMAELTLIKEASLVYIIAAHVVLTLKGGTESWQQGKGLSMLYWVQDGAIVGEDVLFGEQLQCSMGCFISAEGLATDISGFKLVLNDEKKMRAKAAYLALCKAKAQIEGIDLSEVAPLAGKKASLGGGILIGAGVMGLFISPIIGLLSIAGGVRLLATHRAKAKSQTEAAGRSLRILASKIADEVGNQVRRHN